MSGLLLSLRPKQWIKNFFIFLPLIFGKKLLVYPYNLKTLIAFGLFCLASSAVYLSNDLMDRDLDKRHPSKQKRPIASGKVSVSLARSTALILCAASAIFSFWLKTRFGYIVSAYLVFNYLYSKIFKNMVIIDVFCIAFFFYLRILAGSIVSQVNLSHWILFMTILLALFLGFSKRRQELQLLEENAVHHRKVLHKYDIYYIDQMIGIITSSIVIAYTLYTVDSRTVSEFGTKNLMLSIPFVYYGIFRYLYALHKVKKQDDPTQILLSDKILQINILLWIIVCVGVIYFAV